MIGLALFLAGFAFGAGCILVVAAFSGKSDRRAAHPQSDIGALIMAISADIQTQLDRLAQVPAQIQAAEKAAAAGATQNHADDVAALTSATDAIVAAVTPPPAAQPAS